MRAVFLQKTPFCTALIKKVLTQKHLWIQIVNFFVDKANSALRSVDSVTGSGVSMCLWGRAPGGLCRDFRSAGGAVEKTLRKSLTASSDVVRSELIKDSQRLGVKAVQRA